jgi:hydroxyethylthiazole kinase-like uncharacterized protein yjeF
LCGPGNNGGDGFVVARLLAEAGWEVEVYAYGNTDKLPPDAKTNLQRWQAMGSVEPLHPSFEPSVRKVALVVDALFGTGLTRPLNDLGLLLLDLHDVCAQSVGMRAEDRPVFLPRIVAVDLPSGLCSDSGQALQGADFEGLPKQLEASAAVADLTVSFHRAKLGHVLADGPGHCGRVITMDIGLRASSFQEYSIVRAVEVTGTGRLSKGAGHKFSHGHALILSGGAGRTGAARLAARGALRVGAGLVTLGVPGSAQMEVASQVTAIMLRRAGTADELAGVLEDTRINAVCLGPGLGIERARELVPVVLQSRAEARLTENGEDVGRASARRAVVLDADALTAFADAPEMLFGMLHETCVLTPHGGEFARLFPDIAAKLAAQPAPGPAYSKVDAAREAAARAGCVVLFKGPDTVIAAPDGRCSVNAAVYDRAAPWLATAGSGDVLAGFITGLLARGFPAMQAAETGAWLHVECARSFGPGLIAEDLPEELPKVFRALGL